jgi:hypothetical protein
MLFLPFENLTITTSLNQNQVRERLLNVIEPPKALRSSWKFSALSTKPYQGLISGNTFKINRIINHRNSFLPVIEGKIYPEVMGCTIKVKMQLHIAVILFLLFWFGNLLPAGLVLAASFFTDTSAEPLPGLTPLLMCLGAYLTCMIAFKVEARNSKDFLEKLFKF